MDTLLFLRPARAVPLNRTLVGYVGSGDLEVMIDRTDGHQAEIHIRTSTQGSEARWQQLIERMEVDHPLPAMRMDIHDFAATPGVIRLRIEQALELALDNRGNTHD
ncbi:malonate decarboxylase acyl carrier protein [Marinobacterium sedimentorum]|uniref:malonate decarboxylase acyl carrier protein n=1 Tax=Marinobacterium sedimentorum TaxID=2927804 RepID=UPI0020C73595|nr:malonate decarboxylase acyl carrier protein [Marinobacterium sedimentorum]MCP8688395.1 malonate decarboxylase acyl carrier protein [Marinobacterium sedimentorum]